MEKEKMDLNNIRNQIKRIKNEKMSLCDIVIKAVNPIIVTAIGTYPIYAGVMSEVNDTSYVQSLAENKYFF